MNRKIAVSVLAVAAIVVTGASGGALMAAGDVASSPSDAIDTADTTGVTETLATLAAAGVRDDAPNIGGTFMLSMTTDKTAMIAYYTATSPSAQQLVDAVASVQGNTALPVTAVAVPVDFANLDSLARALSDPSSSLSVSLGMSAQGLVDVEQTTGVITIHFDAESDYPDSAVEHPDGTWTLNVEGVDVALDALGA